jgi:DNA-binding response OmpR family regulator
MCTTDLYGRSILVLEDEPLIALEICEALTQAGAKVFVAHSLRDALQLADHPSLSAAIVDVGLTDGEADGVCERLVARAIPFVIYTGHEQVSATCRRGVQTAKPARSSDLIATVVGLLH